MKPQLNLAPEIYQSSLRAKRKKQLATTAAVVGGLLCTALIIGGIVVYAGQQIYLGLLTGQIKSRQQKVASYTDLPKAVTAARHLESLNSLMDGKVSVSHFFDVLQAVAPTDVAATSLTLDSTNKLEIAATAKSYSTANKLAKALEAAGKDIGPGASPSNQPYFSNVQLSAVSQDGSTAGAVDFKINLDMASEVVNGR